MVVDVNQPTKLVVIDQPPTFLLHVWQHLVKVVGFKLLPRRWVVERSFGWLNRSRRLSKDYEQSISSSEAMIMLAMIRIMLRHLARAPG